MTGETRIFGLLGDPVAHSVSPALHNSAFQALGLDCIYLSFRVAATELAAAIAGIRALGIGGVNVTIPHKERVIPLLDRVDDEAGAIGAVNTIVNHNGVLTGYNTDAGGFLRSLQEDGGFDPSGQEAVLLGAGGAARGIAFVLAGYGLRKLWIWNRHRERAAALAKEVAEQTGCQVLPFTSEDVPPGLEAATLLVNATPVGMYPHSDRLPELVPALLHPEMLVYDAIYNPPQTRLLQEAQQCGCRVVSGIGMLTWQGALAFQLWTGLEPPVAVMRRAVVEALQNFKEMKQ